MISIAIIDVIGLTYDGTTLSKRGLGGSESAVILMSKELAKLGFKVTVFNNCIDSEAVPGVYDGVTYRDHTELDSPNSFVYDVVISSRTVIPFLTPQLYSEFAGYNPQRYQKIKTSAKYRAVWMHDTFCKGDHLLEDLVVNKDINELFTLSDFHTSYVTNCDHGKRRMFEVLKNNVFMTRNGIVNYKDEVDIAAKDPYLYVYNASVTKGMLPLVNSIWPKVKEHIPQAKLKVIGGYYRFRENAEPDEQEKTWRSMVDDPKYRDLDIEFTGVIKQSEIAEILSNASFTIYPGAFPETFGISSLESLIYNTPLITTRFGALEETAVTQACYLIDYAIEPNGLFPGINASAQVDKFVDLTLRASSDRYLLQQKQYYCNIVKDISTWDTVALQWKQHLYRILGQYLPVHEYRAVSKINNRVQQVFGRRFSNKEERYIPRTKEKAIKIITPVYNAERYIAKCIASVVIQDYDNWEMFIIDDASTDSTFETAIESVPLHFRDKIQVLKNTENRGAVYNQITTIKKYCNPEDIIMLLDGDDSLVNSNQIFHYYNNLYDGTTEFSYGSCWSQADKIPLVAQPYPKSVKANKSYRTHKFNWNMPYTHLRTFKASLLDGVDESVFKDQYGNWYKAGGDGAVFYSLIEKADPDKVKVVQDVVYNYNDINPLNDYKVNGVEQTRNANAILEQKTLKNKFSVIIPTMWRALPVMDKALRSYIGQDLVGEIILINNDVAKTPDWDILQNTKIRMINQTTNIKVNPAWNLGVALSTYDKLCIANDDIWVDPAVFSKLESRIQPGSPVHGLITGEAHFNQPASTDFSIDFIEWKPGDIIHCFGQLMFMHKSDWVPIIPELEIYFGDDFIFHCSVTRKAAPIMIYNTRFESPMAQTSSDKSITGGYYEKELPFYQDWSAKLSENINKDAPVVHTQKTTTSHTNREKQILIAIPTNKYIEPETFKSVYDLEVPEGYKTHFQYFYGYSRSQIRNLIAHWAQHYDYTLLLKRDTILDKSLLIDMLAKNKDIVLLDNMSCLFIKQTVFVNLLNYPHFQPLESEKIEELDFVERAKTAGASVSYLATYKDRILK
jgi:glycosyltransferase involved in cell wall biosynthesis